MTEHRILQKTACAAAVSAMLASVAGDAMAQAASPDSGGIQEVIVTANRIAQPASKIPLALTVLSGDDLKAAGAVNASSLTELVPNVQISNNAGSTVIAIRGVSSADTTEKGDPSAAFNIDGVNLARPQSAGLAFFDLERVEVLRGPQGTLYGRNATAGAINLITNKPVNKQEGSAAVEYGNYNSVKIDGMLNVPVNDMLAIRGAVSTSRHDGYLRSTQQYLTNYDDDDSISARLHALLKVNPDLSVLLSADVNSLKGSGAGTVPLSHVLTRSGTEQRTATPSVQGFTDRRSSGVSGEAKYNTALGELTYQVAHRTMHRNDDQPFGELIPDVAPMHMRGILNYKQTSHEVRLASTFGQWRTIAGYYWFSERTTVDGRLYNFPGLGTLIFLMDPTTSSSKAVFGETTYSVTPDLHLIAGLRKTNDVKARVGKTVFGEPAFFSSIDDASVRYSQMTGRIGADYALSKTSMVYATYSTGYKAGGFNDGTPATNPFLTYNPEHLKSFEVGVKGRYLNKALQVNASYFNYDYRDLQLTSIGIDPSTGAAASNTLNAAKAAVSGVELEGRYLINTSNSVNFAAAFLDAKFKEYHPRPTISWSGYDMEKSPRQTFNLSYTHNFDFEDGAALNATMGTRYSASYKLNDVDLGTQLTQAGFTSSSVNLNYTPAHAKWVLQAYVRNIENKNVITAYAGAFAGGEPSVGLAPPRTAGIRISANF
jgi:iron complex outermembrane receptor protein